MLEYKLGMEQKLKALDFHLRTRLEHAEPSATAMAERVYALRPKSLIRPTPLAPVIAGALTLAIGLGWGLSRPTGLPQGPIDLTKPHIEVVSPKDAETVWERLITPNIGKPFHLTLDLRNRLSAHEVSSQKVLWQQPLPAIAASSAPTVFQGRKQMVVSVATAIGAVYHIAAQSGQILWMQNLSDRIEVSPLPIADKIITIACADGRIYGLNQKDGSIEYMLQTDSSITAFEPVADGTGEHIYAVADNRRVLALNARTGDLKWRHDVFSAVSDGPLVTASAVITATKDREGSKLWAFDKNGEIRWINTFDRYSGLAAGGDFIALAQGPLVTLIRAANGEPVHYWQLDNPPSALKLVREGGRVIVRTEYGPLISAVN